MVVFAIVTWFVGIVSSLIGLMPNMRIDFNAENQQSFTEVLQLVSSLVPLNTVLICVSLVAAIYAVEFLWLLLNWLIAKIPMID